MKSMFLSATLVLGLLAGCQVGGLPPEPQSSGRPGVHPSTSPMGTPQPSPTVSPTPGSSSAPTASASLVVSPSPSVVYKTCADLPEKPVLGQPKDMAVSLDGQAVYFPVYVPNRGSYLYKITADSSLHVLDLHANELACNFMDQAIEKDSQGRLHLLVSQGGRVNAELTTVFRLQERPEGQLKLDKAFEKNQGRPDPSPSAAPDLGFPVDLYVDEKDQLYIQFDSRNLEYPSFFFRVGPQNSLTEIFLYSGRPYNFLTFDAFSETLYWRAELFQKPPYPQNFGSSKDLFRTPPEVFKPGVIKTRVWKGNLLAVTIPDLKSQTGAAIWRIFPQDQKVEKIAGGKIGFKDGQGEEAAFSEITAMDVDGMGNIFVADAGNHAIRKVTPQGVVSTFYKEAGTP